MNTFENPPENATLQDKHAICNALMTAYKDNGVQTEAQAEAFLLKVVQVRLQRQRQVLCATSGTTAPMHVTCRTVYGIHHQSSCPECILELPK